MRTMMRRIGGAAAVAVMAAGLAGCGSGRSASGTSGRALRDVDSGAIPTSLGGLDVSHEDVRPTLAKATNTYLSAAGLFSMRRTDVVQATLEVARFNARARVDDPKFRAGILNGLGGATPTPVEVGSATVFLTRGNKQRVFVWFRSRSMMVLSVRDDYDQPRSLLRAALGVSA